MHNENIHSHNIMVISVSAGLAFRVAAVLHSKDIDVTSLFDSIEVSTVCFST